MRWSEGPDVFCWMLAVVRRFDVQDVQHRKEEVEAVQSDGGTARRESFVVANFKSSIQCFLSNAA